MKIYLVIIRMYFKLLGAVSPRWAGTKAFKLLQKPRRLKFKPLEEAFYKSSHSYKVDTPYGPISCYEVGEPSGDLVFLVHGWESNAGSMSGVGKQLAENGFRVISMDLPAHGKHKGTHTNLFECKEVLKSIIYQLNPEKPFSIVSHSFGSAVATFALSEMDYSLNRFICLTSPDRLSSLFEIFKGMFKLSPKVYSHMLSHIEPLFGMPLENITVEKMIIWVDYNQLAFIHDVNDKVLNFEFSKKILHGRPRAELIAIEGSGHYRMLWNDEVYGHVLNRFTSIKQEVEKEDETVDQRVFVTEMQDH